MIRSYRVQQTFYWNIISKLTCVVFKHSFTMSGGQNPNPLNGSLPPDWNRCPSMNSNQQTPCYNTTPFPNAANRRPANAFGYNPNQQHTRYSQQQYVLPATHMWNNQMQYHQNSLYQQQHPMSVRTQFQSLANPNVLQPSATMPTQQSFDFMPSFMPPSLNFPTPNYPSLSDRLSALEHQFACNCGQQNPNNFGSALNSFVQDVMYVPPAYSTLTAMPFLSSMSTPPLTTLYQSNLLKECNLNLTHKVSPILEVAEEAGEFDLSKFLTPSDKELLKLEENLNGYKIPEDEMAFKLDDSVSQYKWPTQTLNRHWQTIRPPSNSDRTFHFSIMNYNVLAQDLLEMHPELYGRNDEGSLNWNTRWANLRQEFQKFNCDIICLQEVQESHKELFDVNFKSLGYGGIYKKRTGDKTDGCAIYYRENMFTLLEFITVEYNQPRVNILDRDNIAIIAKFQAKRNEQEVIIANTHLLFNPRRQDIRLVQTQLLLTEIDRMAFKTGVERSLCEYHPVIIVGDFNSTPDSSLIEFIKTGYLNYENLNKRTLAKENITSPTGKVLIPSFLKITDFCQHNDTDIVRDSTLSREEQIGKLPLYHSEHKEQQAVVFDVDDNAKHFSTGTLRHNFHFQSVYNHGTYDNPEGTTNQGEWITTDYIFFNRSSGMRGKDWKLNLISRFTLPTQNELRDVAIPNYQLGSDHLSLIARFALKTP